MKIKSVVLVVLVILVAIVVVALAGVGWVIYQITQGQISLQSAAATAGLLIYCVVWCVLDTHTRLDREQRGGHY